MTFSRPVVSAFLLVALAVPAHAGDLRATFKKTFGVANPDDFAMPIFIGLIALTAILLYIVSVFGKRRQRRLIKAYDAKLADYSANLRKGKMQ